MNVDKVPGCSPAPGSARLVSSSGSNKAYRRVASHEFRTSWIALYRLAKLFFSSALKLSTKVRCASSPQRARRAERAVEIKDLCKRMREWARFLSWYADSLTRCASSSRVVVAADVVTAVICGLKYWDISWSNGSGGSFDVEVDDSEMLFFEGCSGPSCLRGAGEGDARRVALLVLSRSAGFSRYEKGGRWGLRDWYRCNLGGTPCLSGGEGVGLRDETCVMVGETAVIRQISIMDYTLGSRRSLMYSQLTFQQGRTRRGVRRSGEGQGALHLYHRSIWRQLSAISSFPASRRPRC